MDDTPPRRPGPIITWFLRRMTEVHGLPDDPEAAQRHAQLVGDPVEELELLHRDYRRHQRGHDDA